MKRPKTMSDEDICREIYDAIICGRLPPGARLGQDELGEVFGVSKTRIRPILHLLAQQKIVVIEPMRGVFVARPSVEEARSVNAARQIVEEGVIRTVTRQATQQQLDVLRENISQEQHARMRGESAHAHRLTGEFHCELAAITGNEVIVDVVRDLISRDSLVVALYLPPGSTGCSMEDHLKLIDVIESGDENTAAICMRQHLQKVVDSLDLDQQLSGKRPVRAAFRHIVERNSPIKEHTELPRQRNRN